MIYGTTLNRIARAKIGPRDPIRALEIRAEVDALRVARAVAMNQPTGRRQTAWEERPTTREPRSSDPIRAAA